MPLSVIRETASGPQRGQSPLRKAGQAKVPLSLESHHSKKETPRSTVSNEFFQNATTLKGPYQRFLDERRVMTNNFVLSCFCRDGLIERRKRNQQERVESTSARIWSKILQ